MATAARSAGSSRGVVVLALTVAFLFSALAHLGVGGAVLGPGEVIRELLGGSNAEASSAIVWQIRLPRMLGCVLVGAMLSVVGAAFQALFRNPLAEPYVVGVSSGAAVGGVLAILLGVDGTWGGLGTMALGFITAMGALLMVFGLARRRGVVRVSSLLLSGVVVGALLSSLTTLFLYLAGEDTNRVLRWLMGSTTPMFWDRVLILAITALLGSTILMSQTRMLNAFAVGESTAGRLGVDTGRLKAIVLGVGTAMVAVCVGAVGIIGFLGLVAPHISRRLLGVDWRVSMPGSILVGATLLLCSDIVAQRIVRNFELPVGVVTAIVGAPFLLVLLRRDRAT